MRLPNLGLRTFVVGALALLVLSGPTSALAASAHSKAAADRVAGKGIPLEKLRAPMDVGRFPASKVASAKPRSSQGAQVGPVRIGPNPVSQPFAVRR
jgi:hypothetical protein